MKLQSIFIIFLLAIGIIFQGHAVEPIKKENKLKVAFVMNFIRYTEWPDSSFPNKSDKINVCIFTGTTMENAFFAVKDKIINSRELNIRPLHRLYGLTECHVLYVDNINWPSLSKAFSVVKNKPVLTITDEESRPNVSGIINLVRTEGKLRFQIFKRKIESTKLKLSSRLIKLAVNKN